MAMVSNTFSGRVKTQITHCSVFHGPSTFLSSGRQRHRGSGDAGLCTQAEELLSPRWLPPGGITFGKFLVLGNLRFFICKLGLSVTLSRAVSRNEAMLEECIVPVTWLQLRLVIIIKCGIEFFPSTPCALHEIH